MVMCVLCIFWRELHYNLFATLRCFLAEYKRVRLTSGRVETVSIGTQPHVTEACTPFSIAESQSLFAYILLQHQYI